MDPLLRVDYVVEQTRINIYMKIALVRNLVLGVRETVLIILTLSH